METGCREDSQFFFVTATILQSCLLVRFKKNTYLCNPNMNWKFILQWVVTFTVCLLVYDFTGSFWMSLGILILLIVAKNLVADWIAKRKEARR